MTTNQGVAGSNPARRANRTASQNGLFLRSFPSGFAALFYLAGLRPAVFLRIAEEEPAG